MAGWIAVDLDGTLAQYDRWRGIEHIGAPIPKMVARVQGLIAEGWDVRIFTARVAPASLAVNNDTLESVLLPIQEWCRHNIGRILPVTSEKDLGMIELYDDRCKQVVTNEGLVLEEYVQELVGKINFLLTHYRLFGPEGYTFPDGDHWRDPNNQQEQV